MAIANGTRNVNIELTIEDHRNLLFRKIESGVPHWKDFLVLGAEAIRQADESGTLSELARSAYDRMGKSDEGERVANALEALSAPSA